MRRSEVFAWLQAHGGQKYTSSDWVEEPNPLYDPTDPRQVKTPLPSKILKKKVTWVANDGKTLSVIDDSPPEPKPIPGIQTGPDPGLPESGGNQYNPEYRVVDQDKPAPRDTNEPLQTEYQAGLSAQQAKEAQANLEAGRGYHTNDDLAAIASKQAADARAEEDQQAQRDARLRQIAIDERAAKTQDEQNRLAKERLDLERENARASQAISQGSLAVSQGNLTVAQQAEERQRQAANKPQFLSTADPGNKNIAYFDPTTGQIASTANPNYDAVKVEAEQLQKDLALGIQLNQYTASEAKTKYDQWFQQNVTVPFMAAQEERARAADQRAAMQAEEQRNQFGAQFGLQSAEFGETAGQHAAQNEISLLPYRVGPTFGAEMSSAINSLAAGGKVNGPSASAGINFSPGAFTFKRPDFEGIAAKATAKALSHLTPYKPTAGSFPSVSGGAPSINFGSAPTSAGGVDLTPLINQFTSKYAPQTPAAAPAPPVEPSPPDDQPAE